MKRNYSLSVILPVYNEEGNISKVIEDSVNFLSGRSAFIESEIIVVDDGSRDKTAAVLREIADNNACLKVITHSDNLGYGRALLSGLRSCRYPLVFFMDADGQFRIRDLEKLMPYIEQNEIVAGYRKKRRDPVYRIILGKAYAFLFYLLFGLRLKDINCGFKLFKRRIIDDNHQFSGGLFNTELLLQARNKRLRIKEVPVQHFPRLTGRQTGGSFTTILKAATDIIKLNKQRGKWEGNAFF